MINVHHRNSWAFLAFTFLLFIIIGAVLLEMPFVQHKNGLKLIDSIFTATSAVCVTGLTVVDTESFNIAGKLIILFLIQVGGIGIMTLSSSLILIVTGEINLSSRVRMAKLVDSFNLGETEHILKLVITYTFICEALGTIFLAVGFYQMGNTFQHSLWLGFFHSISAFCNAGFSTFNSSLMETSPLIKIVISVLIITGGLGFYVIFDLFRRRGEKIRLHTRIVLITTTLLLLAGFIVFYLIDIKNISVLDAFFQSVTARTAGFNTIDISSMPQASIFFMLILMLIGASPGSTGGGIKTTTAFIAGASISRVLQGYNNLVIFKRSIPNENILRAFAVILLYFTLISAGTFVLLITEGENIKSVLFETVSAVGTVGLSLGLSMKASFSGKIMLTILMFIGRIGPSTLILILLSRERSGKVDYPNERIIIG